MSFIFNEKWWFLGTQDSDPQWSAIWYRWIPRQSRNAYQKQQHSDTATSSNFFFRWQIMWASLSANPIGSMTVPWCFYPPWKQTSIPLQPLQLSCPQLVPMYFLPQLWRTSPYSRGSGLRWPLLWRNVGPVTYLPSCYPGCPAGQPRMQVGIAPSAAASEDAAKPLHC